MIIQIRNDKYDKLSETEKRVFDFLSENEENIQNLSITNIAQQTFSSIATVSRTIKKCGYSTISELRYAIENNSVVFENAYLTNEILAKSYRECVHTLDNIKETSILKSVQFIKEAEKIIIYARGGTALLAEEMKMELQFIGYNAHVVSDITWMMKTDKFVSNKDLVIILSVMNSSLELIKVAKMAKKINAKLVSCSCNENKVLETYADVSIIGYSEPILEVPKVMISSRIPLMIINRTIIEYLITGKY